MTIFDGWTFFAVGTKSGMPRYNKNLLCKYKQLKKYSDITHYAWARAVVLRHNNIAQPRNAGVDPDTGPWYKSGTF
jgi:hypothetical protein